MKFYHLQIKEIKQESPDAVSIHFWHPLSEQIKYKAGQFITVIVQINGKSERRSYSMSSSPTVDTAIVITIKRVANGLVSEYLTKQAKVGDYLEVIEPMGNFYVEPIANEQRQIILFGAGSGITPLISIAKTILKSEPKSSIALIYSCRDEENIIFKGDIENLEQTYKERFKLKIFLSNPSEYWVGMKGRISQMSAIHALKDFDINIKTANYFLCGPEGMMEEITKALNIYDVPKNQIFREHFHNAAVMDEAENIQNLKPQLVKIIYEGETYDLEVKPHQTILEAALDKDIDLPYSCQAGMCTACMGKCTAGKVKLDEEDGLTENEIAQGYVLTCVAHPLTAGVVIEIE